MKRALAERANKQKEERAFQQQDAPGTGTTDEVIGTPSTLGSNVTNTHLDTIPLKQEQPQSIQQQKIEDLRVEAPAQQPPRKVPKIKASLSPPTPTAAGSQAKKNKQNGASALTATNSNPKKRSRPSSTTPTGGSNTLTSPLSSLPTVDDNEDDEENEVTNTKFYLKHQNRALASELYKYKHTITILERERKVRRDECKLINGALRDMASNWNGMEGILMGALGSGVSDFYFNLFWIDCIIFVVNLTPVFC